MSFQHIAIRRDGAIERLTLNRPEVRNAFNDTMIAELTEWAERIAVASHVRVVVIDGAGPTFCAGADLAWMARTADYTEEENLEDATRASQMFAAIDALPVPVVARIHGAALGGGTGLAAVCDVVIADEETMFGFTEVKLGIVPAVISPFVLAKIGRSAARELFLTGRRFGARHALDIGLIHDVVRRDELDVAVDRLVREIMSAGPEAVAAAKQLIADVWDKTPGQARERTARTLARRRISTEGQEGLRAFLEKRKPGWSGA
ncbi:MAG: enoyl-CoA hydratase-related protein [Vicinamibacterales bacterium]